MIGPWGAGKRQALREVWSRAPQLITYSKHEDDQKVPDGETSPSQQPCLLSQKAKQPRSPDLWFILSHSM